ncbi:hypothetical protein AXG93_3457s1130 [Marchantia polymorpha subsp. ruderalis]|uniref:Uncharacterized protein n=1 Tax=Marchantia polymorpha subsp. ruderalis TaxID=1480154 RepID=A0A176VZH9_MARPO|nr:hypothetical protein AXG93_3457s1130 [Marchantia polymorpha subsp. ruderalis]
MKDQTAQISALGIVSLRTTLSTFYRINGVILHEVVNKPNTGFTGDSVPLEVTMYTLQVRNKRCSETGVVAVVRSQLLVDDKYSQKNLQMDDDFVISSVYTLKQSTHGQVRGSEFTTNLKLKVY